MQRRVHQFPYPTALAVAAVALLATIALASASPAHVDRVEGGRLASMHTGVTAAECGKDRA